jgi:hypothetical protein
MGRVGYGGWQIGAADVFLVMFMHPSTLRYGAINISDEWIHCSMRRASGA